MKKKSFAAAVFDLDGVLVSTDRFHFLAWKRLAGELGIPFDEQTNRRLRGVSRLRSLEIILESAPEGAYELEKLADRKNSFYVEMIKSITPADLFPGVEKLLDDLRMLGVKIGVASASKNALPVLERLEITGRLDAITDGHSPGRPKPAPDVFLECAAGLKTEPSLCVVIEDAPAGIEAGKAAGMFTVGVGERKHLKGADMVVSETAEIPLSLWEPR